MSDPLWPYPGSRWWKMDFHTHTPASNDTTVWQAAKGTAAQVTPERWLQKYMEAEIDLVAVTDHNTGAWIDGLKSALAALKTSPPPWYRPLVLFPGVELSVSGGLHVLALFDPQQGTAIIDSLLGAVKFPPALKGHTDSAAEAAFTQLSLVEVIVEIHRLGGLAIPAHTDQPKGLLQISQGKAAQFASELQQVIADNRLIAVETVDRSTPKPQIFEERKVRWTEVVGSDGHNFQTGPIPGSRFTWVKMEEPCLEGLQLALIDGQGVSIRRFDEGHFDPTRLPKTFVRSVEVREARSMGRDKPAGLKFSPYANALIGGRGTGKSTVVHALRLAYQRSEDLASFERTSSPKAVFEAFRQLSKTRNDEGALKGDTVLTVEVDVERVVHRLTWRGTPAAPAVELWQDGAWQPSPSQAVNRDRFPIQILSQGQIAEMAKGSHQALLDVIDAACGAPEVKDRLDEALKTYRRQKAQEREIQAQLAQEEETRRKATDLQKKLDTFAQSHHAQVLQAHQRAARQVREDQIYQGQLVSFSNQLSELATMLNPDDPQEGTFDPVADLDIVQWRTEAQKTLEAIRVDLVRGSERLSLLVNQAPQSPLWQTWHRRVTEADSAYEQLKGQLAAQGVEDPQEFGRLVQQKQLLDADLKRIEALHHDAALLKGQCEAQQKLIQKIREELTNRRQTFLSQTLAGNPYVRMGVIPYGQEKAGLERDLRTLLFSEPDGEKFQPDIDSAVKLLTDAKDRFSAIVSLRKKLDFDESADWSAPLVKNLRLKRDQQPETQDRIETWFPEDGLSIDYSRDEGKTFEPITQGSAGQRAAALLAFLMAFGTEPLILDQPEDDLDNHLIYNLIVQQIRTSKQKRQLIIATHNPNVVVNGDADLVHAFDFRGQCFVKQSGALQNKAVRDEVCLVMEGGSVAFARRWNRLGRGT